MLEYYDANRECYETSWGSAYELLEKHHVTEGCYVKIFNDFGEFVECIESEEDLVGYRYSIARAATWGHTIAKDHINPSHYKDYMPDLQWLEAMQYLPRFKDKPDVFAGAVELQIRKYLDRNGGKDEEIQELSKALWYMKFLVAYLKEGKPIRIEAINKILGE